MENQLAITLFITVLGMTLLFLTLFLFYGLLALLSNVFKDRPAPDTNHEPMSDNDRASLQAAAVAVAIARARAQQTTESTTFAVDEPDDGHRMSDWWTIHHQRQLLNTALTRRAR